MGNQQSNRQGPRKRTIDERGSIFKNNLRNVNASLDVSQYDQNKRTSRYIQSSHREYNEENQQNPLDPEKSKENDRVLDKLSRKNQQLRKELKKISDQLTEQLKKKKFVPKKKVNTAQQQPKLQNAGLKRELEHAYRQIDMYKNNLQVIKSKENNQQATLIKMQRLQNDIVSIDGNIGVLLKKIQGIKNIKKQQDSAITQEMNDDMHQSIDIYSKELEQMKKSMKEYAKRDRERQNNYKKQQAYLCEVQQKWRIMNGQYAPTGAISKTPHQQPPAKLQKPKQKPKLVPVLNEQQFHDTLQQLKLFRAKHEQYHRKIDVLLQLKNKAVDEHHDASQIIQKKQTSINTLLNKIEQLKKLLRPHKRSIFGGYQSYGGPPSQLSSELGRQSQLQGVQQKEPDQFDIKHLIANIPKPARKKPQQIIFDSQHLTNPKMIIKRGQQNGMMITKDKSQPKKWDQVLSRVEERGNTFKGQLKFNDGDQFQEGSYPLIVGLSVWTNMKSQILGIQAIYLNKNDIRYGYKSSSATQGLILHYDLQRPDYIKNITGYIGSEGYIEQLVLSSKHGKIGRFGNGDRENLQSFNFGLSSAQRPFLISGATTLFDATPRLNKIGIQICTDQS